VLHRCQLLAFACASALGCHGKPWLLGERIAIPSDAGLDAGSDAASATACAETSSGDAAADAGSGGALWPGQLGHWQAEITGDEAPAFPAPEIALEILPDRTGRFQCGDPTLLPPLLEAAGGYLCSAPGPSTCTSTSGFIAGFEYSLLDLSARDSILSFRVELDQPWQGWCGLQLPVLEPRVGCAPHYGVEAPYDNASWGDTCSVTRSGGEEPIDCARLATLERNPCACTRERCEASHERSLTVNLRLVSPDHLEGALWFDSEHALALHFDRPTVAP
jgi:hypothetical protein